jgi:sugar O-acyltransferase (sialic acid O-acetyltransferase NeuD family)
MKDLAIYGAGGFGKEVACLISLINRVKPKWHLIGFFDDGKAKGEKNEFGIILGGIDDLNAYDKPLAIVISIGIPSTVENLVAKIHNANVNFPNIIAPDLFFLDEPSVSMGKGNLIMVQSLISYNVKIGDFNLFNCGVSLGHEVSMGSYNSMMSYVKISGDVNIGSTNFFGTCSVVLQGIQIGNYTTIGTNSVIMRKTKDYTTYLGNPASEILKPKL